MATYTLATPRETSGQLQLHHRLLVRRWKVGYVTIAAAVVWVTDSSLLLDLGTVRGRATRAAVTTGAPGCSSKTGRLLHGASPRQCGINLPHQSQDLVA
jgi:hypothetical protein